MKANVIAIVNFKGGVGKSTIANLLELPKKLILNLDDAQNAEVINTEDTYNFQTLKEDYGVGSIKEAIDSAIESGRENIILDTPGEIGNFIEILSYIDYFIVPFTAGDRSTDTTLRSIEVIDTILDDEQTRKDKWCIILNKFIAEKQEKELDELFVEAKKILKDKLKSTSKLKFSQVVPTIEKTRENIKELSKQNPIAYTVFRKRIKEMNKDIEEFVKC